MEVTGRQWETAGQLTIDDLRRAFKQIEEMPAHPHVHLISADASRRVKAGGRAHCVGCGAVIEMVDGEVRAHF